MFHQIHYNISWFILLSLLIVKPEMGYYNLNLA